MARRLRGQLARFAVVGAVTTVVTLALFAALVAGGVPRQGANLAALLLGTVVNTAANRHWTFGVRGSQGAARHQLAGLGLLGLHWCLTATSLLTLHRLAPDAGTVAATAAVGVGTAVATVAKFVVFRAWMRPT